MNVRLFVVAVLGLMLGAADVSAQRSVQSNGMGWIGIRYDLLAQGASDGRRVTFVRVTDAVNGGPASLAGIAPGDTIIRLNGSALSVRGWTALTQSTRAGDQIRLTIQRDGRRREVLVSAGERPVISPSVATRVNNARRDMTSRMESVRDRVERTNRLFELELSDGDSVRQATLRLLDNIVRFNYSISDSGTVSVEVTTGGPDGAVVRIGEAEERVLARVREAELAQAAAALRDVRVPQPVPSDRWVVRKREPTEDEAAAHLREHAWTSLDANGWLGLPGMASDLPLGVLLLHSPEADSIKEHMGRLQLRLAQVDDADRRTRRERNLRSLTRSELRANEDALRELAEEDRVVRANLASLERKLHDLSRAALARAWEESPSAPRTSAVASAPVAIRGADVGVGQASAAPSPPPSTVRRPSTVTAGFAGQNIFAGAQLADLNEGLAAYFDVDVGVLVTDVFRGTPAARVGVQSGDVLIRLNRRPIRNLAALRRAISRTEGDDLDLVFVRRGEEVVVTFVH